MSIYLPDLDDPFVIGLQNFQTPEIPEDAKQDHTGFWLGRELDQEHRKSLSLAGTGRIHLEETKSKISKSMQGVANVKGLKRSDENKKRVAEARRNAPRTACPHCGKMYQAAGMALHIKSHT